MSDYSDLEEMVAGAMAASRVPPSTVYMDGSHNPRPWEYLRAREVIAAVRADERRRVANELEGRLVLAEDARVSPLTVLWVWIEEQRREGEQ